MKNHLKENIFQSFLEIIEQDYPELSEAKRRRLAEKLMDKAHVLYMENSKGLMQQLSEMTTSHEAHRGQFKKHIDMLQKETNRVLVNFKQNGFVTKKYDENRKITVLKGRTTMVDDMVDFLNIVNDSVILFYKEVYKIEETTNETPQITLF
jgi:hypothetical protein